MRKSLIRLRLRALALLALAASVSAPALAEGVIEHSWNAFMGRAVDPRNPSTLMYPTVAFSPETSWEFGLAGLYVYYANRNLDNRLSEVSVFGFLTFEEQYGLIVEHALYSDHNAWLILGELRYQNFPLLYYGIGPATASEPVAEIEGRGVLVRERVLRQVAPSIFAGLELSFDSLSAVHFRFRGEPEELPLGGNGSTNLLLGSGIVYDNLHNALNPRGGAFIELAALGSSTLWGSDFAFGRIISDSRGYFKMNPRDVLAVQALADFTFGAVPVDQLSLMGGEQLMRGYYLGRFRDRNQLAAQVEYRMLPLWGMKRWGSAFFLSTATVFPRFDEIELRNWKLAGGLGLRFLLFPEKDVWSRLDVAFTGEGTGYYLYIGESF